MGYQKKRARMDRTRLQIGTYCLSGNARTEAHVKDLHECGIDYLCSVGYDRDLFDKLEKFGMGVFVCALPGWWGGNGENAGTMAEHNPLSLYTGEFARIPEHPAIWGYDIGDEPSALDFPHYGKVAALVDGFTEDRFAYLNLYPTYASSAQLGTGTYTDYVEQYVAHVPGDYICYDNYMYGSNPPSGGVTGAYENMRVVADVCRRTGRDFWIVLQANSPFKDEVMHVKQLYHQAFTALAFGAVSINWACWTAGWWENNVLDAEGQKTPVYDHLKKVNTILHGVSPLYMSYRNVSTHFLGRTLLPTHKYVNMPVERDMTLGDAFTDLAIDDHAGALVGHMIKRDGTPGELLVIADITCPSGMERGGLGPSRGMDNFYNVYFKKKPGYTYRSWWGDEEGTVEEERDYVFLKVWTCRNEHPNVTFVEAIPATEQ